MSWNLINKGEKLSSDDSSQVLGWHVKHCIHYIKNVDRSWLYSQKTSCGPTLYMTLKSQSWWKKIGKIREVWTELNGYKKQMHLIQQLIHGLIAFAQPNPVFCFFKFFYFFHWEWFHILTHRGWPQFGLLSQNCQNVLLNAVTYPVSKYITLAPVWPHPEVWGNHVVFGQTGGIETKL